MPDPPQNLDINKTLIYLLQRVNKLEAGDDEEGSGSFTIVLPAFSGSGAVSSAAAANNSAALSVVIPSISGSGVVIP